MSGKKRKIIQFLSGFGIGGAENIVKNYCLFLDKNKYDVVVLCVTNYDSNYDKELAENGIRVIYINDVIDRFSFGPTFIRRIFHRMLRVFMVRYYIKKEQPDVIHSHARLNRYLCLAGISKNTKLFITVHSDPRRVWRGSIGACIDYHAVLCLRKRYETTIIGLHREACRILAQEFGVYNTEVLYNGVDTERFKISKTKEMLRKEYGIEETEYVISYVARFAPVKNHNFLVDIFYEYLKVHTESCLWLIGDGRLKEEMQVKTRCLGITDRVVFWGVRSDIPELLTMTDIIVFPSFVEGLSVSLIESQIAGLPALVSDTLSEETDISGLLTYASLEYSPKHWAEEIEKIRRKETKSFYKNINEWDIRNVVKKLDMLYSEKYE